ncbi:unnamed protein product [Rotaria socialis]|uniref:Helix-turn-helix domain-containing protein n=2 Tax=Rotaria socialis TaxID=392032 RepID=A0A818CVA0_9BILA|nr:unnamed protein product [Rotaria socialis]
MRAIRYSSTFEAFNIEPRTIRLTLLYNNYPSIYINEQFFLKYLPMISLILPLIENQEQFVILRKKLLEYPSVKQILVDKSAATVEIVGHRNNQNIEYELTTKRPCSSLLKNQPLQKKKQKVNEPNTTVW